MAQLTKIVTRPAVGPLVVSKLNSRYFTIDSGNAADRKAIYLTGSHIWNNFHDGMGPGSDCSEPPAQLDYGSYLKFLTDHGHNFIRLWRWEQFKSQAAGGTYHLCMTPSHGCELGQGLQGMESRNLTSSHSTRITSSACATA